MSDLVGTVVYNARAAGDTAEMARATMVKAAMTKEEAMCFTTQRGWPSEAYFVQGEDDETCLDSEMMMCYGYIVLELSCHV